MLFSEDCNPPTALSPNVTYVGLFHLYSIVNFTYGTNHKITPRISNQIVRDNIKRIITFMSFSMPSLVYRPERPKKILFFTKKLCPKCAIIRLLNRLQRLFNRQILARNWFIKWQLRPIKILSFFDILQRSGRSTTFWWKNNSAQKSVESKKADETKLPQLLEILWSIQVL